MDEASREVSIPPAELPRLAEEWDQRSRDLSRAADTLTGSPTAGLPGPEHAAAFLTDWARGLCSLAEDARRRATGLRDVQALLGETDQAVASRLRPRR